MPAARAAVTPAKLSSITRQRAGDVRICSAANRNRSGAGLPLSTCTAEKMCGANRSYNPTRLRLALIFSGGPLDATHFGKEIAVSATSILDVASNESANNQKILAYTWVWK